ISQIFRDTEPMTRIGGIYMLDKVRRTWKIIKAMQEHNVEPMDEIVDFKDYITSGAFNEDLVLFRDLPVWKTPHPNPFGWNTYFETLDGTGLRIPSDYPVWVINRPYIEWLFNDAMHTFEVNDWKAYFEFCILYNTVDYSPELPNNVY